MAGSVTERACEGSILPDLPVDVAWLVLDHLAVEEIVELFLVCKSWHSTLRVPDLWTALLQRDYTGADEETLALAAAKAKAQSIPAEHQAMAVYRQLAQLRVCDRCQLDFREGANAPHSCRIHPGVLFSGGVLNGNGVSWTCCNRRAHHVAMLQRHADGCTPTRHVSAGCSLWMPHRNGVIARPLPIAGKGGPSASHGCRSTASTNNRLISTGSREVEGGGGPSSSSSSSLLSSSFSSSSSTATMEWHPDRLPNGLEALPSRICLDNQFMRLGF